MAQNVPVSGRGKKQKIGDVFGRFPSGCGARDAVNFVRCVPGQRPNGGQFHGFYGLAKDIEMGKKVLY